MHTAAMEQALLLSAVLMGLAGTPHCLAMCGAACAAASGGGQWRLAWPLHLGRGLAYSAAGAVAAASVGSLASLAQAVQALKPLWTLVHLAALVLGVLLLVQGRQPAWMERMGRRREAAAAGTAVVHGPASRRGAGLAAPWRAGGLGLAWVAWPCGLLQSALLVAALANTPAGGAAVMAGFALASAAGLLLGPALWVRLAGGRQGAVPLLSPTLAVRLAGAVLAAASAWAVGHDLLERAVAWCLS